MRHAVFALGLIAVGVAHPAEPGRISFQVTETAGIRRFGYPVEAHLTLASPIAEGTRFRLLRDGKPVAAQFTLGVDRRSLDVDFGTSMGPNESQAYVVEHGPDVMETPIARGVRLEQTADDFIVHGGGGLQYTVPKNLKGFLRSVKGGKLDYLHADGSGLAMELPNSMRKPIAEDYKSTVVKAGPLAAQMRFEGRENAVVSTIVLTFPISKSWLRVDWDLAAPTGPGLGLLADVRVKLQSEPALVDFGNGSQVYTQLKKGEAAEMRSIAAFNLEHGRWEVRTGKGESLTPFVRGMGWPEGWAHVMDQRQCTAAAIHRFRAGRIRADADGRLTLASNLAEGKETRFTFWLHFVPMPYHVGAMTSPQSMQQPLLVNVK